MATQFKDVDGVRVTNGVATAVNTADLTVPPTQGELATTFGSAASQVGKIFIHDEAGANTTVKLVVSNGSSYYFVALTKA